MNSDVSSLFSSPEEWGASHSTPRPTAADYVHLSLPNLPVDAQYAMDSVMEQPDAADADGDDGCGQVAGTVFGEFGFGGGMPHDAPAPQLFAPPPLYSSQAVFTATNARASGSGESNTISPLQTHFDRPNSSFGSDASFSTEGAFHSATSVKSMPWDDSFNGDKPRHKRRCNSLKQEFGTEAPIAASPPGRRRKSENVEPGSARAVYLEKNRKAASKCRNKQKKQQEELIETARDVERKNRALKAEVEVLKDGMRELMELVGRHTNCPDSRLSTYVQREADRLAAGAAKLPALGFPSPDQTASFDKR